MREADQNDLPRESPDATFGGMWSGEGIHKHDTTSDHFAGCQEQFRERTRLRNDSHFYKQERKEGRTSLGAERSVVCLVLVCVCVCAFVVVCATRQTPAKTRGGAKTPNEVCSTALGGNLGNWSSYPGQSCW
ncbi:hypothetical protein BO99DRAFT_60568 [Aspergillus violaceofuscus CBS 115571]|uniref:Uncharacterized protein n=1 Tax=Aspergillus violaceofuscus (strain CBS 115571) TaxID=1450538 RepID=A0A2V5HIB6_ASPV1|nr:hypothetical protein BO99DRAFT_60568 [Aspergillus violaceofuscus CBS 115571]